MTTITPQDQITLRDTITGMEQTFSVNHDDLIDLQSQLNNDLTHFVVGYDNWQCSKQSFQPKITDWDIDLENKTVELSVQSQHSCVNCEFFQQLHDGNVCMAGWNITELDKQALEVENQCPDFEESDPCENYAISYSFDEIIIHALDKALDKVLPQRDDNTEQEATKFLEAAKQAYPSLTDIPDHERFNIEYIQSLINLGNNNQDSSS